MKIVGLLRRAEEGLSDSRIDESRIEAQVLVRRLLGLGRAELFANLGEEVEPGLIARVSQLVERRTNGEPLAYIVGRREFYGLDFVVNGDVMVPRQETEVLVERVLELARRRPGRHLEIADVGTGCGAIAIAIAHNLKRASLYATDRSPQALGVAKINRRRHKLSDRVHLREGDLLSALPGPVDVIVSNPPYLKTGDMAGLAAEVRREPSLALDGGADGMAVIGRLLQEAPSYLIKGGCMLVEIAPDQLEPTSRLAEDAFPDADISFAKDLLGLPRTVIADLAGR